MKNGLKYKIIRYFRLITLAIIFYFIYYLLFHNTREIWTSLMMGLASAPFNMIITGFLINNILNKRELYREKKQINMVVGIFYNEIGVDLLKLFVNADRNINKIRESCKIKKDFMSKDYENMKSILEKNNFCVDIELIDLNNMKSILNDKCYTIINLVINPVLTNNEDFIETALSVLYLRYELNYRTIDGVFREEYEKEYLIEEINRCYHYLTLRWIEYIEHLKNYYPNIFEKALINSPFDIIDLKTKGEEYFKK